jgi:hypothetical protein
VKMGWSMVDLEEEGVYAFPLPVSLAGKPFH